MEIKEKNHRTRLLNKVSFNADGLICAIAQDHITKTILMVAWMNREALDQTLETGNVVYYSRSRRVLWRKGETSGQTQELIDMRIDCDRDAILLKSCRQAWLVILDEKVVFRGRRVMTVHGSQ